MMYLGALVVLTILSTGLADRVPAMIWSNDQSVTFPAVLAGHTVSTADFEKNYIDRYSGPNKNLIVFLQNKLSIADISHYANIYGYEDEKDSVFSNVKALMSEETSTHLPNVISPVSVFENNKRKLRVLSAPYDLEQLFSSLGSNEGLGLVLVRLSDVETGDYQQSLRQNDKIIGDVIRQLENHQTRYTAIYTAVSSGRKSRTSDQLIDSSPRRQLLADTSEHSTASNVSTPAFFNVSDNIYLYIGSIGIANSSTAAPVYLDLDFMKYDPLHSSESCNTTNTDNTSDCSILLKYDYEKSEPFSNISLKFSFALSSKYDSGYWNVSALELGYIGRTESGEGTGSVSVSLNVAPIGSYSPLRYSFSCSEPDVLVPRVNKTEIANNPHVYLKHFQVQAYGGFVNSRFGYYNDCQSFFSIAIWMALISMAVMLGVLVFGLYMLCQISTMDRFDDPKGKTIIVAAGTD